MNWKAIKHIYHCILIHNYKIEYFGNDIYKIIRLDKNNKIRVTTEYKNGKRHGKSIVWDKNGIKYLENTYVDGINRTLDT